MTDTKLNPSIAFHEFAWLRDYRIGDDGSIWSRRMVGTNNRRTAHWKRITQYRRPYGSRYCVVCMRPTPGGKLSCFYVHRLVLEAFRGQCPEGMEACHNDGDTTNNRLDNLRWDTKKANAEDTDRHGHRAKGSKAWNAKLTEGDITEIRRLYAEGMSQTDVGSLFGVKQPTIGGILRGEHWSHVEGENPPIRRHALTVEQVQEMRRIKQDNPSITSKQIAATYGVHHATILRALSKKPRSRAALAALGMLTKGGA